MPPKPVRSISDSATILERSRGVFFAQWEELRRLRSAVMNTADPDDIHDLRVASRRFRAALDLFKPILPKASRRELKKNVRMLTRSLGGLRNIDEALLFFQSRAQTDDTACSKLCDALSERRPGELKRIGKALKSFDCGTLDRLVRKLVAGLNEDRIRGRDRFSLLPYFSDVSIRLYMPIHQLLAVSAVPGQCASRHALRIAIKKWRYFFEIIAQILNRDYAAHLELLKEYQSLLGRMNDIAEFRLLLGSLELSAGQQEYARAALLAEDAALLENFAEFAERRPLGYTFLI